MLRSDPRYKKLKAFCQRYGMKIVVSGYSRTDNRPTWNLYSLDMTYAHDEIWALHELAHFITGNPQHENWGLGADPSGGSWSLQVYDDQTCREMENRALVATFPLMNEYGCTTQDVVNYKQSYAFDDWSKETQWKTWDEVCHSWPRAKTLITKKKLKQWIEV